MRKVDTIVLHYSATYEDQDIGLAEIRAMHLARGWKREGYHEIIRLDGRVEHGRPWDMVGAGVLGQNTGKLHICAIGGLRRGSKMGVDTRTPAQEKAQISLINEMERKYGKLRVVGHSELAATQCPGFIGSKWWAGQDGRIVAPIPPEEPVYTRGYLRVGSRSMEVLNFKRGLKNLGYHPLPISSDYFGKYTEEQVKAFQKDAGIVVDGKVGPVTWTHMIRQGGLKGVV